MTTTINVIGTVGSEPELRFTTAGTPVVNFSIADNHRKKDQAGNWVEAGTTWYRVNAWDQLAQNVAESIEKGQRVWVQGRVENRKWQTDDGTDRYSLEITAYEVGPSLKWATAEVSKVERTDNVNKPQASSSPPWDPSAEPF